MPRVRSIGMGAYGGVRGRGVGGVVKMVAGGSKVGEQSWPC